MKCLIAMLFLAGSLNLGLSETVFTATPESSGDGPVPPKQDVGKPSYLFLGSLSLISLLIWRRRQQART